MVMNGCADSIRNVYFYFDHYLLEEHFTKLKLLTEYYRFHNEIPRLFMLPVSDIMNKYHQLIYLIVIMIKNGELSILGLSGKSKMRIKRIQENHQRKS
jgi:DNA integrity scanning protein DisA with diadenylate cyclase activity